MALVLWPCYCTTHAAQEETVEIPDFLSQPGPEIEAYRGPDGTYSVPLTVDGPRKFPIGGTPVRCGLPLPLGLVRDAAEVRLLDARKREVLVQAEATGYWHDGSIKWLLLDFLATGRRCRAEVGRGVSSKTTSALRVRESKDQIAIITGPLKLSIPRRRFAFPGQVWLDRSGDGHFGDDEKVTDGGDAFVQLDDENGKLSGRFVASEDAKVKVVVEARGPVRATVRRSGSHVAEDGRAVDPWAVRIHAFAGQAYLEVEHTFINNVDVRKVHTMALGLDLPVAGLGQAQVAAGVDGAEVRADAEGQAVSLRQINAEKKAFPTFDQFQPVCTLTRGAQTIASRQKATGWLSARTPETTVCVALRDMWQMHPKELQIDPQTGRVRIHLQPDMGEPLDWFGGVDPKEIAPTGAKWQAFGDDGVAFSHQMMICFGDTQSDVQLQAEAFCAIPNAFTAPLWLQGTKAAGCLSARDPAAFPKVERVLDRMVEWLYRHQNEWFHWYGITDYGGVQTHYQPAFGHWSNLTERFGWLNAEAEPQAGVALHYLRSGSRKAFELMRSMNRHAMDVDYVHLGKRRGFGRRHFALHWGQPGDWAHTFLRGPALCYHATGDDRVWDVMQEVGDLVLRSGLKGYKREACNFQRNAMWLYEITRDKRYRRKAEVTMASVLRQQNPFGLFEPDSQFHTNEYLLWAMALYDRTIGSHKMRDALVRLMDCQITPFGRCDNPRGPKITLQNHWEGLQHAYLATGDTKYLWPGLRDLTTLRYQKIYERFDPVLRFPRSSRSNRLAPAGDAVRPDSFVSMHYFGRHLAKISYFLYAAKQAGLTSYESLIDSSLNGTYEPWSASPKPPTQGRFQTIDIQPSANAAPLSADPFGYTEMPTSHATSLQRGQIGKLGHVVENLAGLPWGATAVYDGIPFRLPQIGDKSEEAIICLRRGAAVAIPVNCRAERLHFLGQVLANGNLDLASVVARYVIQYRDGSEETVEWQNLANCEDWRYLHYSAQAPLAATWAPGYFEPILGDMTGQWAQLRHINTLSIDTKGKDVEQIRFEAGEGDCRPMLLALTAEGALGPKRRATGKLSFGGAPDKRRYSWRSEVIKGESFAASRKAATLSVPLSPGAYDVEILIDSSGPMAMAIDAGRKPAVSNWQLVGEWHGVKCRQRIVFRAEAKGEALKLRFRPSADGIYKGNNAGSVVWGLGWELDPKSKKWRRSPAPFWRLYEVTIRKSE